MYVEVVDRFWITGSHFSCQAIIYEYYKQNNANFTDDCKYFRRLAFSSNVDGWMMSDFVPSRFPKRKLFKKDVNSVLGTVSHSSYRYLSVNCWLKRLVLAFGVHQNVLKPFKNSTFWCFWVLLDAFGCFWVGTFVCFGGTLVLFCFWVLLVPLGAFWCFGVFWGSFGFFWVLLGALGAG